ncbi:MAG TPA: hypothetical protein VEW26_13815 [Allosphingosinicella sp.]|nr:hypothetical protein [Allosphingosinicella sp.]
MLDRLFPKQVDNRFDGRRSALWLLGLLIALKLVVSLNSIFNTALVAQGADGIPLDSYGPAAAREVVTLFALVALGQLILALVALAALIRWRSLVPFLYLVSLVEMVARRLIVETQGATQPAASPIAWYVTWGVLILLVLGLALSLIPARRSREV